ncbi:MAG: class I SAM-dependent methyltransferase [Deltaproteobacteria bacterium]|nr:class I SAM-dependent methyltransferase [Deltaproteobacteria bacterium]
MHDHHHHHHDHFGNPDDRAHYLAKLEGSDRAAWQKPDQVIRALKLRKSDVVAEVGAGPAYFAKRLAKKAAFVYAVEADPQMFPVLLERTAKLANLAPVFALQDAPRLAPASVDLILIVNTFHHLDGARSLRKLALALKPRGRIANIDFHPESELGPKHKISRDAFVAMAKHAKLKLVREHTFLREQYFVELAR